MLGDDGVVGVARGRPAHVAVALAPLHPGRAPRRVGAPDPAVRPHPAAVVIGRPPERIGRLPRVPVVGVRPVAVRIGNVRRRRRREDPAVRRVAVPAAVRREVVIEDVDRRDVVTRHPDVHGVVDRARVDRRARWRGRGRRGRRRLPDPPRLLRVRLRRRWLLGRRRLCLVVRRGRGRLSLAGWSGLRGRWVVRPDITAEATAENQQLGDVCCAHAERPFRMRTPLRRPVVGSHSEQNRLDRRPNERRSAAGR